MPRYRKKPVVIEAHQLTENNALKLAQWSGGQVTDPPGCLTIRTLEGDHRADMGDYIIRGVKGEFYPVKPEIFEATYERVEDAAGRKADQLMSEWTGQEG